MISGQKKKTGAALVLGALLLIIVFSLLNLKEMQNVINSNIFFENLEMVPTKFLCY